MIIGKSPPHLPRLQHWMEALGFNTIWDISKWEIEDPNRWVGWALSACPEDLEDDKKMLLNHLAGIAPIAKFRKDMRGWGRQTGSYSASEGYQSFAANYNVPVNQEIWNYLWKCSTLPKIDLFT